MSTKICQRCEMSYEYLKRVQYKGKSPKLCPTCKIFVGGSTSSNMGARPKGHKTRQQHKRVRL